MGCFRIAVAIDGECVDAINNLAVLVETVTGDINAAQSLYRRALAVDKWHAPTLSNYAHHLHTLRHNFPAGKNIPKFIFVLFFYSYRCRIEGTEVVGCRERGCAAGCDRGSEERGERSSKRRERKERAKGER